MILVLVLVWFWYDLTHQDLTQCPSVTKPRAEEWQLHRQVISRSHKAHNAYNDRRRGWNQSSYLSHISQIISVEKILSCGEISDFCIEFEQLLAFYRNLCRFSFKFVWRKIFVEKKWQIWGLSDCSIHKRDGDQIFISISHFQCMHGESKNASCGSVLFVSWPLCWRLRCFCFVKRGCCL